jgi:hypothetical protein
MKNSIQKIIIAIAGLLIFSACHKVEDLPYHKEGKPVTLTASKTAIAPAPADSTKPVVSFSWTNPEYATDTANQKFVLEIDSAGRNFSSKVTHVVTGALSVSLTGQQINNILAGFGFLPGQTFGFDVRVTSSYANNNEAYQSNVIKVSIAPYVVPVTLTPSSASPLVLQVANATNTAVSFNWTASPYGSNTIQYTLQMDTAGGDFAHPQVKQLGSNLTTSLTVNELNTYAIAAGVIGGTTKNVQFRIASYLGTGYTTLLGYSTPVTISVTSFTPIPANLYIVGDATPLQWNNNAGLSPTQEFSRIDDVSYGIVINLTAGKSYLFLPVAGSWDHKYGGASATGGNLLADGAVPGSNTPAPAASGTYRIVVNFQTGTYTVTAVTNSIPDNLYLVGDAAGSWDNPVALPQKQFTKIDAGTFGIIAHLEAGKSYLFLPENGKWDHKYGGTSATQGTLLADGDVPGSNTPAPVTTGWYKITVNFVNNTYTVTPYTGVAVPDNLYIVGDAVSNWDNPVPPAQYFTRLSNAEFKITVPLASSGSYLFLPLNGNWDHKFGGTSGSGGVLLADGAVPGSNTPPPSEAATYQIVVNFFTMKYALIKQ